MTRRVLSFEQRVGERRRRAATERIEIMSSLRRSVSRLCHVRAEDHDRTQIERLERLILDFTTTPAPLKMTPNDLAATRFTVRKQQGG